VHEVTADDFWRELRELREVLDAEAPAWNARLHRVLRRTATRRHRLSPELVACLRELRADDTATRLDLTARLDRLLAEVVDTSEA